MTTLFNIAKMTVSSAPGTSDIPLNAAVTGWLSFASAGATNGVLVAYNAVDGSAQEDGTATYSSTGPTLTGRTLRNSTTGSLLSLSSSAIITLTASKEDIVNKTGDTMTGALNWATPVTVASASTTTIGAAVSNYVLISGTTTITAFDTVVSGAMRLVEFQGILTLTYNSTSLILPGAASITTAAGDTGIFISEGSGNWRCLNYSPASGKAVVSAASAISLVSTLTANNTATSLAWTGLSGSDRYMLFLSNLVLGSSTVGFYLQVGEGGTPTWDTSGYESGAITAGSSGAFQTSVSGILPFNPSSFNSGSGSTGFNGVFFINGMLLGSYVSAQGNFLHAGSSGSDTMDVVAGAYTGNTNAKTALRLIESSGNLVSGSATLYKVS